jgi:hypothetical protein
MPHDDESPSEGRLATGEDGRPEVEVVLREDDPVETDEWDVQVADDGEETDGFLSTGHDEVFDTDGMFDALSGLAEADLLTTVKPIEIPDDEEPLIAGSDGGDGAGDEVSGNGASPRSGGVNAVLERLQAADEAAASGSPVPLRASKKRLGEILVDMGLVSDEQIEACLIRQKETRQRLGQMLLEDKIVSELDLTKALATKFGIEYLDLTKVQLDMSAAGLMSERLCRRYGAIPVRFIDDTTLQVAMIDPANVLVADDLRIMTGYTIMPAIASEEDVFGAIGKLNRLDDQVTAAD